MGADAASAPQNCAEYNLMGYTKSGIFPVDPDGPGPLGLVLVRCDFGENAESKDKGSWTVIDSSIPEETIVRASEQHDSTLLVKYRLGFETFFGSTYVSRFSRLSEINATCPCGVRQSCVNGGKCNCDADLPQSLADEGFLSTPLVPITNLSFAQSAKASSTAVGKVTLCPLECTGLRHDGRPIRLTDSGRGLPLKSGWRGEHLRFWFRTTGRNSVILQQIEDNGKALFLSLLEEDTILCQFHTNTGKNIQEVSVKSENFLNDGQWHQVEVTLNLGEAIVRVDSTKAFDFVQNNERLKQPWNGQLVIGKAEGSKGAPSDVGFQGCIWDLVVDRSPANLEIIAQETLDEDGIYNVPFEIGCAYSCSLDTCGANGRCFEDYENGGYKCICNDPFTQSGDHCENDVNAGPVVSLHSDKNSYLTFENLAQNPVFNNLLFSFKTDQGHGLILYAHDQFMNFLQVTMVSQKMLTFTTNYQREIKACSLFKNEGEFGDMSWIQLRIEYEAERTVFYADDVFCDIQGRRILADSYIDRWDQGRELETVIPPHLPVNPEQPGELEKYNLIFLGGIPNPETALHRIRRQARSSKDNVFYITKLPNLRACMRGLQVALMTVHLDRPEAFSDSSVQVGCTVGCEEGKCFHGGHCVASWSDNTPTSAFCDCSLTSYLGPHCSTDTGLSFAGNGGLALLSNEADLWDYYSRNEYISFSFSTTHKPAAPMLLFYIRFKRDIQLEAYLDENSHLQIKIDNPDTGLSFAGNGGLALLSNEADLWDYYSRNEYISFSFSTTHKPAAPMLLFYIRFKRDIIKRPLWGFERILRDGQPVGFIRRAEYGFHVEKSIAYGYVHHPDKHAVTTDWLKSGNYELDRMGECLPATLHLKTPFDPNNDRLKGHYHS